MIDTHAHLYDADLQTQLTPLLERALAAGVATVLLPNTDKESFVPMMQVVSQYPKVCKPMLGLHPCYIKADFETQLQFLDAQRFNYPYVAIGEVGLDFYWDKTFVNEQYKALELQIEWASEMQLPLALHTRNATSETTQVIRKHQKGQLNGVFHCFSGTYEEAVEIIDLGFKLGIGGVVTFKNSTLPAVLEQLDVSHLVLETDSPYLAPVPYRGKTNEPAYLTHVCDKLAQIFKIEPSEIQALTNATALRLFEKNWFS